MSDLLIIKIRPESQGTRRNIFRDTSSWGLDDLCLLIKMGSKNYQLPVIFLVQGRLITWKMNT